MAQKQQEKVKGCKKCGRNKRKQSNKGSAISLFVRNRISAKDYFTLTNQITKVK